MDPLEACAFGARLGNQSVFILDPRLKGLIKGEALRLLRTNSSAKSFYENIVRLRSHSHRKNHL